WAESVIFAGIRQGKGYLRYYDKLGSIQGKKFDEPTVLLVGEVKGDEDIPEGVTAVITPDAVDLVSHVAVRVRNAGVLFATCYDSSIVSQLKSKENSFVGAHLRGSGDVVIDSLSEQDSCLQTHCLNTSEITVGKKTFSSYALLLDEVSPETAGGKSVHSKELKEGLPQWIETPKSIVIPFGVFEKVVKEQGKEGLFQNLLAKLTTDPDTNPKLLETLSRDLSFHEGVVSAVQSKMTDAGFSESFDPQALWKSIKGVWASVWSKRAVESRRVFGFPDDAISMAVLVQEVIPAEYAFVIHTVNPSTGKKDELFAEVVPGLGETLVGSHAGRAFGFLSNKKKSSCKVVSFPSKSYSLKGSGIICRSDSSAEDLSSYSGAGVYDSILLSPPKKHLNEYVKDPLIADPAFRESVVQKITGIGNIVEKYFKAPQDIEGVYAQGKWYVVQARPQAGVN
ncbi:MAG: phosphohistidine-like domain-containing protein, partial [Nitrospinota bacterium]